MEPTPVVIRQNRNGDVFRVGLRRGDTRALTEEQRRLVDGMGDGVMFDCWGDAAAAAKKAFPGCTIEAD